jgi:hypothetical protein
MTVTRPKSATHPLLPGEASVMLNGVAFLFAASGGLLMLLLIGGLVGKAFGWDAMASLTVRPGAVLIRLAIAAGYLWTGWLLFRRRVRGGVLGLAILGLSLAWPSLVNGSISRADLLIAVLGKVGLALSWSHLGDARSRE